MINCGDASSLSIARRLRKRWMTGRISRTGLLLRQLSGI